MRFHSKYHQFNHHTDTTAGYPDSATDPIASESKPFQGDFYIDGQFKPLSPITTWEVDTLVVNNAIAALEVTTLTVGSIIATTITGSGAGISNVNAVTLGGQPVSFFQPTNGDGSELTDVNADTLSGQFIDYFLLDINLSSTVAPLIPSDNDYGFEVPIDFIPDEVLVDSEIGVFIQRYSEDLSEISTLSSDITDSFIVNNGSEWTTKVGATARDSMGIGVTDNVQFNSVEIDGSLNHDGANIGFFGTAPTTKQTALTAPLTTLTFTPPSVADYALQDVTDTDSFGFSNAEEARTFISVVKNLQDRVTELETKLQAYGLLT